MNTLLDEIDVIERIDYEGQKYHCSEITKKQKRLNHEGAKPTSYCKHQLRCGKKTASSLNDALAVKVDIGNSETCEEMVKKTIKKYGRIDLLVCIAAILIAKGIDEFTTEQWKKLVDINLVGYFNSAKAVVPSMKKQGKRNIIQINSKTGKKGSYKNSAYAASKFGEIGLTQSLLQN